MHTYTIHNKFGNSFCYLLELEEGKEEIKKRSKYHSGVQSRNRRPSLLRIETKAKSWSAPGYIFVRDEFSQCVVVLSAKK